MAERSQSDLTAASDHRAPRPVDGLDDVVILGGGLAGLYTALKLSPRPVTIVSAGPIGRGAAEAWIEGGVRVAIPRAFDPDRHRAATLDAGLGLCAKGMVSLMSADAQARIADLERLGVAVHNDALTGADIVAALADAVVRTPSIRVIEGFVGENLILEGKTVRGIEARGTRGFALGTVTFPAHAVVLATGGMGQLFDDTINPAEAQGQGLGMAARAGAVMADCALIAFSPDAAGTELFHMGGVLTDARGRTSLDGLWAVGEVAATGVHGAGFLPVNALLEALVFASRAAADLQALMPAHRTTPWSPRQDEPTLDLTLSPEHDLIHEARRLMSLALGRNRDGDTLADAFVSVSDLARRARHPGSRAMLAAARVVLYSAWVHHETLGKTVWRYGEGAPSSMPRDGAGRSYCTISECDLAVEPLRATLAARRPRAVA